MSIPISTNTALPKFRQLYRIWRQRIVSGQVKPGERLPSTRVLAQELGLSRTTILSAFDQLVAEGYAETRPGAGTYATAIGKIELVSPSSKATPTPKAPHDLRPRPFAPGQPDMRLFPYRDWARILNRAARTHTDAMTSIGDAFGDRLLREQIATHLSEWRGLSADPEQIIVTAGSGEALELSIRTLTRPGKTIAFEDPGYLPMRHFASSLGMNSMWLDIDADGACLPDPDMPSPSLIVLTPSHQFPLGGAMPGPRRLAFVNAARQKGGWIIEDDFDSEFRYSGQPIRALAGMEGASRVVYVGSFSKVFSSGLRIGYLVVPRDTIDAFQQTLSRFASRASVLPQRPLAMFLHEGLFHRHIRRVRRSYAERYQVMTDLLATLPMQNLSFQKSGAGMQIALHIANCNDQTLATKAQSRGLACLPLTSFSARTDGPTGLLLGFCGFTPEEIRKNFPTLQSLIETQLNPPSRC